MTAHILVPKIRQASIRQEGTAVQLIVDGRLMLDLPWDAALALAQAIHVQAKKAEELAKADQVIYDQAILLRAGLSIGFATDPAMIAEAGKEAAWNSDLRRYMENNLDQSGTVFPPSVIQE